MRGLLAQLRAELVLLSRRGENLLVTIVLPLGLLVFFAGAGVPAPEGVRPLDYLVSGIVALAVMSTSMVSLGIATAFERYYGVLKRLLGSPLPRSSLLLAKALSVVVLEVFQVALVLAVAAFGFGWQPSGSLPLAAGVLVVGSIAFAGIGLLMAGSLRAEATLALANGLYLVFLLIGGFVFPVERLPGAIGEVARLLPAAALSDSTRSALSAAPLDALTPLALLAGWAVVGVAAAAATFKPE